MSKKLLGPLLIICLFALGAIVVRIVLPMLEETRQKAGSDAERLQGDVRLALDNWIGYFPLRSAEMRSRLRQAGWRLAVEDDNADYATRMQRLKDGELDFAVATVDSFILNAAPVDFPATIIMVIDESKGGDAILARQDRVAGMDAIKGKTDLRVAFTPGSPSHHLAKAAAEHFDVPELLPPAGNSQRIETDGSEAALQKLLAGTADVAICWEPDVSKGLAQPGIVKILGTEDTAKLIVDILLVRKEFAEANPEVVELFLATYFRVLKQYRDAPEKLQQDVQEETGLGAEAVQTMLGGVHWVSLTENSEQWFGISAPGMLGLDGLVETIESTVRILVNAGDFTASPLPGGDPYRLIRSDFLERLFHKGLTGFTSNPAASVNTTTTLEAQFPPLSDTQWAQLQEVATLKMAPIVFQTGASELDFLAKEEVDKAVSRLTHYPNFRIEVRGHTSTAGDAAANQALSQDRADAVARYLQVVYNIDQPRLRAKGFGGERPLPQQPGESLRAWRYRLPRVELVLVRDEF